MGENISNNEKNCKQAKLITVKYRDGKDKENVKLLHEADQVRVRQHHYLWRTIWHYRHLEHEPYLASRGAHFLSTESILWLWSGPNQLADHERKQSTSRGNLIEPQFPDAASRKDLRARRKSRARRLGEQQEEHEPVAGSASNESATVSRPRCWWVWRQCLRCPAAAAKKQCRELHGPTRWGSWWLIKPVMCPTLELT